MVPRNLKRRKQLPRGFTVSLTAVEVCVSNAERLLNDATKVSPPSAAALAELSIEEIGKAWMLYFRLLKQGRKMRFGPRLSAKETGPIEEYFERHADHLLRLDAEILEGFRWHGVKLRFLGFLLGYIELALPLLAGKGRLVPLAEAIHGPAFNVRGPGSVPDLEGVKSLLKAFQLEKLSDLAEVKERGLYVNISSSGELVSPEIELLPPQLLMMLSAFLIQTLKGDLLAISKS